MGHQRRGCRQGGTVVIHQRIENGRSCLAAVHALLQLHSKVLATARFSVETGALL